LGHLCSPWFPGVQATCSPSWPLGRQHIQSPLSFALQMSPPLIPSAQMHPHGGPTTGWSEPGGGVSVVFIVLLRRRSSQSLAGSHCRFQCVAALANVNPPTPLSRSAHPTREADPPHRCSESAAGVVLSQTECSANRGGTWARGKSLGQAH
jgi:hypothetical protein